jgi:hypothetical protein
MGFLCTVDLGGTLGTTSITFVQFSGAGQVSAGAGLTRTGNTLDVVTASSARIVVNADSIDLATTGVGAGTYRSVTVDTYGRVTGGTNPTTLSGYGITDAIFDGLEGRLDGVKIRPADEDVDILRVSHGGTVYSRHPGRHGVAAGNGVRDAGPFEGGGGSQGTFTDRLHGLDHPLP